MSRAKTWEERLTPEQKRQIEDELKAFGLDYHQIRSLMKYRQRVSVIELILMRDLPPNRWGKRATISVVKDGIRTCQRLELITGAKGRKL